MSGIFEQILARRGFGPDFLEPCYKDAPAEIPDLEKAVKRLEKAVLGKEKILIYGDYDVDGVTATALMVRALEMAGMKDVPTMLPDRFIDGYGMSERVVSRAKELKASLVITVDCGSNNADIIEKLKAEGVDTIVSDHHEIMGKLPKAVAIVNSKRKKTGAARELAGVGVAFMLAQAMAEAGMIPKGQEKWLLDLVLIGTICDSMDVTGINRPLCFYGMKVIKKTRWLGLVELMRVAKVTRINAYSIGFQLGPRLNAGGRMESAEISLKLLLSKTRAEATRLSAQLDHLNTERREEQLLALEEIEEMPELTEKPVIVVQGNWHEGVVGIIAGRLVEKYHKPAFVLTNSGGESAEQILKGSGRTFGDFDLAAALRHLSGEIVSGGGHAGACGIKVLYNKFPDFVQKVNDYYESLELKNQERFLAVNHDAAASDFSELTTELGEKLEQLEPFGEGNEEPVILLKNALVLNVVPMGAEAKHLRVDVRDENGKVMKLVAFHARTEWFELPKGEMANFYIRLERNDWQGNTYIEGRILEVD